MPRSTRPFLFPDINVWVALTYEGHSHHLTALNWFRRLQPEARLFFCRFTQLGLLRLLTAEAIMGPEVMTQPMAWKTFDSWMEDDRVGLLEEPTGLDPIFRSLTRLQRPATKDWADSYLAAFAAASQLTMVKFDKDFQGKMKKVVLLKA